MLGLVVRQGMSWVDGVGWRPVVVVGVDGHMVVREHRAILPVLVVPVPVRFGVAGLLALGLRWRWMQMSD